MCVSFRGKCRTVMTYHVCLQIRRDAIAAASIRTTDEESVTTAEGQVSGSDTIEGSKASFYVSLALVYTKYMVRTLPRRTKASLGRCTAWDGTIFCSRFHVLLLMVYPLLCTLLMMHCRRSLFQQVQHDDMMVNAPRYTMPSLLLYRVLSRVS